MTTSTKTTAQKTEIVSQIVAQLAGSQGKLRAMIGADGFSFDENENGEVSLRFSFKVKAKNKAKICIITATNDDLYTIVFGKIFKYEWKEISKVEGYYDNMLTPYFEEQTGLYLSM